MGAVTKLCDQVTVLDHGKVVDITDPRSAVNQYLRLAADWRREPAGVFNGSLADTISFDDLTINGVGGEKARIVSPTQPISIAVQAQAQTSVPAFRTTISIYCDGTRVLTQHDTAEPSELPAGPFRSAIEVPAQFLRPGDYTVSVGGYRDGTNEYLWGSDLITFTVTQQWSPDYDPKNLGIVNLPGHGSRVCGDDAAASSSPQTDKQAA